MGYLKLNPENPEVCNKWPVCKTESELHPSGALGEDIALLLTRNRAVTDTLHEEVFNCSIVVWHILAATA